MKMLEDLKAIKAFQNIMNGTPQKLSISQITGLITNMLDAKKNLSKEEYKKVYEQFSELRENDEKIEMDIEKLDSITVDIIRKFNNIAPYEKYSGNKEDITKQYLEMIDDELPYRESFKEEEGDNGVTEDIEKNKQDNSDERKNWGKGIPRYTEEDLMTKEELLDFAMQIVKQFELDRNGFELVSANNKQGIYPNFVVRKDGSLLFILVKADIVPRMPELTEDDKKIMIEQSKKFDAIPLFAPVGFGSTDPERFDKSIALRGDGFYSNYVGLEEIK